MVLIRRNKKKSIITNYGTVYSFIQQILKAKIKLKRDLMVMRKKPVD